MEQNIPPNQPWICVYGDGKQFQTKFPKWWWKRGDLPWYNPDKQKHILNKQKKSQPKTHDFFAPQQQPLDDFFAG